MVVFLWLKNFFISLPFPPSFYLYYLPFSNTIFSSTLSYKLLCQMHFPPTLTPETSKLYCFLLHSFMTVTIQLVFSFTFSLISAPLSLPFLLGNHHFTCASFSFFFPVHAFGQLTSFSLPCFFLVLPFGLLQQYTHSSSIIILSVNFWFIIN